MLILAVFLACKIIKTKVKTTNLGSLFNLTYNITLKDTLLEKEFLDELRCLNGNLEISLYDDVDGETEL